MGPSVCSHLTQIPKLCDVTFEFLRYLSKRNQINLFKSKIKKIFFTQKKPFCYRGDVNVEDNNSKQKRFSTIRRFPMKKLTLRFIAFTKKEKLNLFSFTSVTYIGIFRGHSNNTWNFRHSSDPLVQLQSKCYCFISDFIKGLSTLKHGWLIQKA